MDLGLQGRSAIVCASSRGLGLACADALAPHTDWSVLELLAAPAERRAAQLERVEVVQPLLFAMMVSLAAMWRAQGVVPDAVIGHSQGEIANRYCNPRIHSTAAVVVSSRSPADDTSSAELTFAAP